MTFVTIGPSYLTQYNICQCFISLRISFFLEVKQLHSVYATFSPFIISWYILAYLFLCACFYANMHVASHGVKKGHQIHESWNDRQLSVVECRYRYCTFILCKSSNCSSTLIHSQLLILSSSQETNFINKWRTLI